VCDVQKEKEINKVTSFKLVSFLFSLLFVLFLNSLVDCFHVLNVLFSKQTIVVGVFLCEEVCVPSKKQFTPCWANIRQH